MNKRNNLGLTPLHTACSLRQKEIVLAVLKACKSLLKETDFIGATALHYASVYGHMRNVELLVSEYNSDPMHEDFYGNNSLHYSASNGHTDVLKYLATNKNCDQHQANKNGLTLAHAACAWPNQIGICFTSKNGDNLSKLAILKYLVQEMNCDLETKDNTGNNPIHYSAQNGLIKILEYLVIDSKHDPSLSNKYGSVA